MTWAREAMSKVRSPATLVHDRLAVSSVSLSRLRGGTRKEKQWFGDAYSRRDVSLDSLRPLH